MKKLTSVLITWAVVASAIPSTFAQEADPFAAANVAPTATTNTAAPAATNTATNTATTNTTDSLKSTSISVGEATPATPAVAAEVVTDVKVEKVGEDKVKVTVEFNSETSKAKTSKLVIKFPDVVTITDKDVVKGDLFDSIKTTVAKDTITVESDSVTAIPAKGSVLTATFNVKPATVKQDYPFTVDTETSSITNELNEVVKVKTDGVKMVELATAAPVVAEAKKETGFEENVALATILGVSGLAFIASTRRKRSI